MTQELEGEALGSSTSSPAGGAPHAERMTFAEKVTGAMITLLTSAFLLTLGIALRNKRHAGGVEDASWGLATETMKRQEVQIKSLQKELDLVRSQRNEFEAAALRSEANSKMAAEMAQRAADLASRNEAELMNAHKTVEKLQKYVRILRTKLIVEGIEVPPEPGV